jgi:hypothetical protein
MFDKLKEYKAEYGDRITSKCTDDPRLQNSFDGEDFGGIIITHPKRFIETVQYSLPARSLVLMAELVASR